MKGFEIASLVVAGISAISTIALTVVKCRKEYSDTTQEINEIKSKMEAETAEITAETSRIEEENRKLDEENNRAHAAKMNQMERVHNEKMNQMDSIGKQIQALDLCDPESLSKCNELLKELYNV